MVKLYFDYGFSCREIARHMGHTGSMAVRRELASSISHLRAVLRLNRKTTPAVVKKAGTLLGTTAGLTAEQEAVFRLRYEARKSFMEISSQLGLPLQQVEQQYITAWKQIRQQQTETSKAIVAHG